MAKSFPACFDNYPQYRRWQDAARSCTEKLTCHICTDCTPEYQAEMIREHRCANPAISFRLNNGMLEGYLYKSDHQVRKCTASP